MIGMHLSITPEPCRVVHNAVELGTNTFQIFIRNNRNLKRRNWSRIETDNFYKALIQTDITSYVVHAPYAMNPAGSDWERVAKILAEDAKLLGYLGGNYSMVVHPGSNVDISLNEAFDRIAAIDKIVSPTCKLAWELMAGSGHQLLSDIEHIFKLIDRIPDVGLCFDTCHVFASGMPMMNVLQAFSNNYEVLHLNNSKCTKGSRVDRHANLATGYIPEDLLQEVVAYWLDNMPNKPIILETPVEGIMSDLELLKSWVNFS